MDHGTAHERIEDLLLDPARLGALQTSTEPEDVALRQHLDGCPACRADLDGWAQLHAALADALPDDATAAANAVQLMEPPASLRARVIAAVRSEQTAEAPLAPIAMAGARRRWFTQPRAGWLGMAAALVVLAVSAGLLLDQAGKLATLRADAQSLTEVMAAVDRVLAGPHKVVELQRTDDSAAGSISWSRHDWVVLTTALAEPRAGQRYKCWLEHNGQSVPVGVMEFAGGTAYWVASVDQFATWEIGPGARFVVTLEAADAQQRTGPAVLEADLGA